MLRPHQVEPANRLAAVLSTVNSAVDLSDTGTGKTYVACAVAQRLRLPTLVVCPKIARTAWERAADTFGDKLSVINYEALRTGRTPFGTWDNTPPPGFEREEFFLCQCCQRRFNFEKFEPCYCHPAGIHCMMIKKREWKYGHFNFHPGVRLTIFDEVHRCGEIDSLNSEMLMAAHRQDRKVLALSATAATTPLKMRALGYTLGMLDETVGSFYSWARKFGCRNDPAGRIRWMLGADEQEACMHRIHDAMMPRGVRVRTDDIPGFPTRDITCELYDLDDNQQADKAYAEMSDALQRLDERTALDVAPDSPLTKILRARQKVELLKVPVFVELANDYLIKGFSVALFVNFRQTLVELCERLKCQTFIDGSPDGVRYRQQNIDAFQADLEKLIIVNNEAGRESVSLHGRKRIGIVSPGLSAVTMRQVLGRLHRDGGENCHYRIVFAARTVEEKIKRALDSKLRNLDALNDGDLLPI